MKNSGEEKLPGNTGDEFRKTNLLMEAALSAGGVVAWVWNIPENRLYGSETMARLFSVSPEQISDGLPLEVISKAVDEKDRERVLQLVSRSIETGEPYAADYRVHSADGRVRWVAARGHVEYDKKGNPVRFPGVLVDITERKATEQALAIATAEVQRQKRLYETILSNTPDLIYVIDLDYRFTYVNDALLEVWGRTLEESIGKTMLEIGLEPWLVEKHEREINQVVDTKMPVRSETPFNHSKLGRRIYDYIFAPVLNAEGEVELIAGTTRDITDRKNAEETQRLLLGELNHRVKNTLATIQAIASQTLRKTSDPSQFVNSFNGRIRALASAHSLLTKTNWKGAKVGDVLKEQLLLEEKNSDYITFSGPDASLPYQAAVYLALILHELGTNARKYGSLSVTDGHLSVNWKIVTNDGNNTLKIEWTESNGPPVSPPVKSGFGRMMIEKSLTGVGGYANLDFKSSGLHCEIILPLSATEQLVADMDSLTSGGKHDVS